ncbi:MAG: type II toxin-antitoxin system VapC family toxin [Rhodospirillales bacterium]
MNYVVDASVAVKWFIREELQADAMGLLDHASLLWAPDWIVQEVAHVAYKKWRDHEIGSEHAKAMVQALPVFIAQLQPSVSLTDRALAIAMAINHPVYDCLYLACAEAASGVLVTADKKFCQAVRGTPFEPLVRYLGDFGLTS